MARCFFAIAMSCLLTTTSFVIGDDEIADSADQQSGQQQLSAQEDTRQLPFVPPAPAPADDTQTQKKNTAGTNAAAADFRRQQAFVHLQNAQRFLHQAEYELVIQAAETAISVDPDNAAEYRQVRAKAYQLTGRYGQALADTNPLEVTVAAAKANLKSGEKVVAVVPSGVVLKVTELRGEWLKVISVGEQKFDWAWIWQQNLVQAHLQAMPIRPRAGFDLDIVIPHRGFRYDDHGGYRRRFYGDDPYYDPYRDHGRRSSYDWWQHVPPRYWRYLPR